MWLVSAVVSTMLSGCGSAEDNVRVERCVDRLLSRAESVSHDDEAARDYTRRTYCERFEKNGWVYADGALSIAAHEWLVEGGMCAVGSEDEPTHTVPCEELEDRRRLDCAMLRHVRRSEVRQYVSELRSEGDVACDDGTPLSALGVP